MEAVFEWVEHHQGLAAWVQAVFSVIAIVATWLITRYEDRKRQTSSQGEAAFALHSLAARQHALLSRFVRLLRDRQNCVIDRKAYLRDWSFQAQAMAEFPMAALHVFLVDQLVQLRVDASVGLDSAGWLNSMVDLQGELDPEVLTSVDEACERTAFVMSLLHEHIRLR